VIIEEEEHSMSDHLDGLPMCGDPSHREAVRLRRSGSPEWSPIVLGNDRGGMRDFLDGQPIHCGTTLELQAIEWKADDFGEFTLRTSTPVRVRYEVAWRWLTGADKPTRPDVVLHADIGGHGFTTDLRGWMRFRWPKGRT
jgi:hypothetical protein